MAYMFVHPFPELASGCIELSATIGMIPYAPSHLVEALLSYVALFEVLVAFNTDILAERETSFSSISSWIFLSSFAVIDCLCAYSVPPLIVAGILYGVLFIVAASSHVLLSGRFSMISYPKRLHQHNR